MDFVGVNHIELTYDVKLNKFYMHLISKAFTMINIEITKELYEKLKEVEL